MSFSNSSLCRLVGGFFNQVASTSWLSAFARTNFAQPSAALFHTSSVLNRSLQSIHKRGLPYRKPRSSDKTPISGHNFYKGIVLKTVIRHPKKPNSGNRKCAIVKLSTGKEVCAYIPGEGHNLQEHSQVMVIGGRRRDLIGVKANIVRGKFDCAPVKATRK